MNPNQIKLNPNGHNKCPALFITATYRFIVRNFETDGYDPATKKTITSYIENKREELQREGEEILEITANNKLLDAIKRG